MSRPEHPRVAAVSFLLAEAGAAGQVVELPGSARTAPEAAARLGVPLAAIVDSLLFDVDGEPLLVLTSSTHRVDVPQVAALLGVPRVRPASPDFVRRHTGQPIGTLVDIELARHDRVWAPAGHPHAVFPTSYDELLRLTGGTAAEVGNGPDPTHPVALPEAVEFR